MGLNPRRRAREVVIDAIPELAASTYCEAQRSLRIIIEDTEQRAQSGSRRRQVTAYPVQNQQCVVAISARRNVVHRHTTSRLIVRVPVQSECSRHAISIQFNIVIELRECDSAQVGRVAARKLDELVADQEVKPSRPSIS